MKQQDKIFQRKIETMVGVVVALLALVTPGYSGEWEPQIAGAVQSTLELGIKNMDFTNKDSGSVTNHILIIPVGIAVRWTNMDPLITVNGDQGLMPHGIQIADSNEKVFTASPILTQQSNTFTHTFSEEGTYNYGCFIHPFMKGKILVINLSVNR